MTDKDVKGGMDDPEYFGNEARQVQAIMEGGSPTEGELPYDQIPYARGAGMWAGVVQIERPPSPSRDSICRVMSARTNEFNGLRAITPFSVPYGMVRQFFDAGDGAEVYAYGEFFLKEQGEPGHFEFYEKASQKEFFLTAGGNARVMYAHARTSQIQI